MSAIGRSVSLGTLSTLNTGGTADFLVVGVDAESGLHHQLTLLTYVSAVFICEQTEGQRGWQGDQNTLDHSFVDTCTDLRLVGCRVLCCRFVPGLVWCWSRIHSCASSLVLDIEPPSSVSPFHKTLSTENKNAGRPTV